MTIRSTLLAASLPLIALAAPGCELGDRPHVPLLEELSADADAAVELIDRDAALDGALDYDLADAGEALDLGGAPAGFLLQIDSADIQSIDDAVTDGAAMPSISNVVTATWLAALADLATAAVVGPPAAAVAITTRGTVEQLEPNVWVANNTLTGIDGSSVSGEFVVAWVGVGWLAEMRISSSDGTYDDTLWFNGFLSYGGALGWWDIYTADGELAGVVEWSGDGSNAQFGIAAISGPAAGDLLSYWALADGERGVAFYDADIAEEAWVIVNPDLSGELRAHNYNEGEPACWDTDFYDAECPAR